MQEDYLPHLVLNRPPVWSRGEGSRVPGRIANQRPELTDFSARAPSFDPLRRGRRGPSPSIFEAPFRAHT